MLLPHTLCAPLSLKHPPPRPVAFLDPLQDDPGPLDYIPLVPCTFPPEHPSEMAMWLTNVDLPAVLGILLKVWYPTPSCPQVLFLDLISVSHHQGDLP